MEVPEGSDGSYACRIKGGSLGVSVGQSGVAVAGLKVVDGPLKDMATIGEKELPFSNVITRGMSSETVIASSSIKCDGAITCNELILKDATGASWRITVNSSGTLSAIKA